MRDTSRERDDPGPGDPGELTTPGGPIRSRSASSSARRMHVPKYHTEQFRTKGDLVDEVEKLRAEKSDSRDRFSVYI